MRVDKNSHSILPFQPLSSESCNSSKSAGISKPGWANAPRTLSFTGFKAMISATGVFSLPIVKTTFSPRRARFTKSDSWVLASKIVAFIRSPPRSAKISLAKNIYTAILLFHWASRFRTCARIWRALHFSDRTMLCCSGAISLQWLNPAPTPVPLAWTDFLIGKQWRKWLHPMCEVSIGCCPFVSAAVCVSFHNESKRSPNEKARWKAV